ncbi:EcsC family protein [Phenylobacterium sp.]|uniref:EcsC family protein n=1 Tax=Phenylobacterium sp. TaxID=1871053 RepID=UPI0025D2E335|nr:EcsC family protein [Phenylobacterium sp.]MBX3485006.1 EcsC family protein [Phenylobacterium sp.]MCW5759798.1 EcsC family protein [Phenylobacterium sp.]
MARAQPPFGATDAAYEDWARAEVARWTAAVLKPPGPLDVAARDLQGHINRLIPERVHATLTSVVEGMTRTILTGADLTTAPPLIGASLAQRDRRALEVIRGYRRTAAVEGGVAGAGGVWLALADFPALLVIKIKLLFDLSAVYGHEADAFGERLYILALFQLAFSGAGHRAEVFRGLEDWDARAHPQDYAHFDWRRFQQEYRDHIDLAKMAQMIPVVGAPVGAIVNWRLLERLGETAMNGHRMRWLARP